MTRRSLNRRIGLLSWATCLLICVAAACVQAAPEPAGTIGVNKFDLLLQYLGTASGGDGSPPYRRVTEAMARKSIADAQNAGIRYLRINAMGYAPSRQGARGDLDLWLKDREAYWRIVDRMMADLRDNGLRIIPSFVWNPVQLPAMNGETVSDLLRNPDSASYRMLDRYLSEFIERYRNNDVVLFYEIGNELNLGADVDAVRYCARRFGREQCAAHANYTADQMIVFTKRVAARIHALDPKHGISSGHAFPRPAAQHLRARPEFGPGGPDWTEDNRQELAAYIRATHEGLDYISVHIYAEEPFHKALARDAVDLVALASDIARELQKPLFIGETGGDSRHRLRQDGFLSRTLDQIAKLRVPYTTLWVWEFYQRDTHTTFDGRATAFNIEPGESDELIERIGRMNKVGARSEIDKTPPVVIVTWPLECARVQAPFTLFVAASDDSRVAPQVELQVAGREVRLGATPPYQTELAGLESGEHEITATATDRAGNKARWTSWVVVGAGNSEGRSCARCCR